MIKTEPFDLNLIVFNELFAIIYDSKISITFMWKMKIKNNNKRKNMNQLFFK